MVESFNIDAGRPLVVHYSPALGSDADDLFGYKIVLYTDSESGTNRYNLHNLTCTDITTHSGADPVCPGAKKGG